MFRTIRKFLGRGEGGGLGTVTEYCSCICRCGCKTGGDVCPGCKTKNHEVPPEPFRSIYRKQLIEIIECYDKQAEEERQEI